MSFNAHSLPFGKCATGAKIQTFQQIKKKTMLKLSTFYQTANQGGQLKIEKSDAGVAPPASPMPLRHAYPWPPTH